MGLFMKDNGLKEKYKGKGHTNIVMEEFIKAIGKRI